MTLRISTQLRLLLVALIIAVGLVAAGLAVTASTTRPAHLAGGCPSPYGVGSNGYGWGDGGPPCTV